MMTAIRTSVFASMVAVVVALLTGCASNKGPAEAALAAAQSAVDSVVAEASKYVPDQAQSLQAQLTALKDKFAKGDYEAVITDAKALAGKAKEVASAAAAKKTELTQTWTSMSDGMPKVVEAIKGRVDILSQSKKLPANMTQDVLASAKSGLGELTEQWTAATEAYKGGNLMDAITKVSAGETQAERPPTVRRPPGPAPSEGRRPPSVCPAGRPQGAPSNSRPAAQSLDHPHLDRATPAERLAADHEDPEGQRSLRTSV